MVKGCYGSVLFRTIETYSKIPYRTDFQMDYIYIYIYIYMWYVQHKDQHVCLSMFLRYGLAFGTRVLKTRVPERAFWVDPFSNNPKLMYFLGLDTETFFPPNKKWFWELLATRKLIFPTPDTFLAEAKKVLASPGLWGKLGFLPGSFFSLKEKGSNLSQILA